MSYVNPLVRRVNWARLTVGGLAAGLIINAFEYVGHRVLLDDAWTATFRALRKAPKVWLAFMPANFAVRILMVWFYAQLRSRYSGGPMSDFEIGIGNMGSLLGDSDDVHHANAFLGRAASHPRARSWCRRLGRCPDGISERHPDTAYGRGISGESEKLGVCEFAAELR